MDAKMPESQYKIVSSVFKRFPLAAKQVVDGRQTTRVGVTPESRVHLVDGGLRATAEKFANAVDLPSPSPATAFVSRKMGKKELRGDNGDRRKGRQ